MTTGKTRFLGISFNPLCETDVVGRIASYVEEDNFRYIVTPNVDHVVEFNSKSVEGDAFQCAYSSAALVLCDSRILALLARLGAIDLPVVTGSDLTRLLIERGGPWRRLAVVGGDHTIQSYLRSQFPHYDWKFLIPPMGVLNDPVARDSIAQFVRAAQADLIFFAIGAPQSEICCLEISRLGNTKGVALCTGASLEFLTGIKSRAPKWMQKAHLEWLHRLASEPARLWRRYLVRGPLVFQDLVET